MLSLRLLVTGATLQPGDVSVLTEHGLVDLRQLETEAAVLGVVAIDVRAYTSLTVTFANPELTVLNNTGAPINGCAQGEVCELRPTLASSSVTLPLAATQQFANRNIVLDFDLANSLVASLASLSPSMTLHILETPAGPWFLWDAGSPRPEFHDRLGEITGAYDASLQDPDLDPFAFNFFILRTALGEFRLHEAGAAFLEFADCPAASFSCLEAGQTVEVDSILSMATQIRLVASPHGPPVLKGVIIATDNAAQFGMVVLAEAPDVGGVKIGDRVQINLLPGASFGVNADTLMVSGLNFSAAADLLPGQTVQVDVAGQSGTATPSVIDTARVILKQGSFTAGVNAILSATEFTVDTLPAIHTSGLVRVEALAAGFDQATSVVDLHVGDPVSMRGLLFKTSGTPVLVASLVRRQ